VRRADREEFSWSGVNFAAQLLRSGLVKRLPLTDKGNPSTSAESLAAVMPARLAKEFEVRAQLQTCLNTFMRPWLLQAEDGGRFYARFNQVRQGDEWGKSVGAGTGRLSMTPNLQNVIRSDKDPRVPLLRDYVVSGPYDYLAQRDYCFSADTEALTEHGWRLLKDLDRTERIAEWRDGVVRFSLPLAYQCVEATEPLVRILGKRSTDLLVSPDHKCLCVSKGVARFVLAKDYPIGRAQQLHAGCYHPTDPWALTPAAIVLLCALQADAKLVTNKRAAPRAVFYLKKRRKVERLRAALRELGISHQDNSIRSKPGFRAIKLVWPQWLNQWLKLPVKTFQFDALRDLPLETRQEFLRELGRWDGTSNGRYGWGYGSVNLANTDVVQALAAVSGFRSTLGGRVTRAGKRFNLIGLTCRTDRTHTDRFTVSRKRHAGLLYCVTMPWSTVIVRRNGRVMVTGQSQQELRILAHYEDGPFKAAYLADPTQDGHVLVRGLIRDTTGVQLNRRPVKDLNFGLIYGQGLDLTAEKLGVSKDEARRLRRAHAQSLPGLPALQRQLKDRARAGEPIWTWGGRRYFCEKPSFVEKLGRWQTWEYKLLNKLIQGSAADATKQAMVNYRESGADGRWPMLLQVHDELILGVDGDPRSAHRALAAAMSDVEFDVPMLSDGKLSRVSWHRMRRVDY
jgi:hypothetical protein